MRALFERCLNADYIHTAEDGDYAVEVEGDTLYLLFEWSDGREDWKNNLDFPVRPYSRMETKWWCHRGFLRVWKAMRKEVESIVFYVLNAYPEVTNIVCVGFSHGAAIAVLATEDMAYLYGNEVTVSGYGFGAPRVLWGKVPEAVKTRLKCFVTVRNVPDFITHVPPRSWGYRDAGRLLKIGKPFKYGPFSAHFPENYTKELGCVPIEQ